MAKWGEGDPRWIVEERLDATNVNNWHWTEKNATPWSKERLQRLFTDFKIEQNDISCVVSVADKVNGEATINNRKGKLIFFYEWELELKWSGSLPKHSQLEHNGKITIPNLSEENALDEVEITITIDESNEESEKLKQFMYNVGREKIREQLDVYIKELKEEYSKNLILPKKGSEDAATNMPTSPPVKEANNVKNAFRSQSVTTSSHNDSNVGCKLEVRTLTMHEEFYCNAADLYNALVNPDMIAAFTNGPAKVDPTQGGEFVIYGGNVQGSFEELVPDKKIQQRWRLKSWPSGHFSDVTIEIEQTSASTKMKLTQTGIPASEFEAMRTNWYRYYWHSIKRTFAFGFSINDSL